MKIKVVSKPKEETKKEDFDRMQKGYLRFKTFAEAEKRRTKINALLKKYS